VRALVTGSSGFIGSRLCDRLERDGWAVVRLDVEEDVLSDWTADVDVAFHLAAHKHAPLGEEIPAEVADLNIRGTQAVVERTPRVVLASTCKAASPVTVYGASKLIAERIVLNAGGSVLRFVNVLGSSGSVTDIWDELDGPLPVTDCERMFVSPDEAVTALVEVASLPAGRYGMVAPLRHMREVAAELYPGRQQVPVPLRRGDRPVERLLGEYETGVDVGGLVAITDPWEMNRERPEGEAAWRDRSLTT